MIKNFLIFSESALLEQYLKNLYNECMISYFNEDDPQKKICSPFVQRSENWNADNLNQVLAEGYKNSSQKDRFLVENMLKSNFISGNLNTPLVQNYRMLKWISKTQKYLSAKWSKLGSQLDYIKILKNNFVSKFH